MHEERAIYIGLLLVCVPVVIVTAARGEVVGVSSTIAGLLVVLAVIGLWRTRSNLPKARARRSRDTKPPSML